MLSTLGEKVAGKPVAKKVVSFITGLLAGDSNGATKSITKDDFIDV